MTVSKEHVETLARQWAVLEGKGELFDLCKIDHAAEEEYGHYEGYIADTEALLGDFPDLQEVTPQLLKQMSWQ